MGESLKVQLLTESDEYVGVRIFEYFELLMVIKGLTNKKINLTDFYCFNNNVFVNIQKD